jgi:hypothetical protein
MSRQSELVNVSQGADGDPLYVDTTNNRVGIGTSSPNTKLDIIGSSTTSSGVTNTLRLRHTGGAVNDGPRLQFTSGTSTSGAAIASLGKALNSADLVFYAGGNTERMRIDSSGNLLVGTTNTSLFNNSTGDTGFSYKAGQGVAVSRVSGTPAFFNRQSADGDFIDLRKNGSNVGSIGTSSGQTYIVGANSGIRFGINSGIIPTDNAGTGDDNSKDLGAASIRWDDVYATNGTIQTSDANEKQQIASLTDAEMQAAKTISALFKTFKWNDSVAEKGEAARTHSGVIAQEVEQAMADAGLDAGDYAFFISTTWWETQTEVPAVEAVEEVLDEEGNVITEAVEAQEAYTRTDTYETAEEAPEGAVERNRKGIRYPQLLAFVGAATEQRLASIEARLDALETS